MKSLQVLICCILFSQFVSAQIIPFNDARWVYVSGTTIVENYKGKNSAYIKNGIVYLKDEKFKNGIIEFDVYLSERVSFGGLIFRVEDLQNYEEIYFRGHHSGHPDAYQYTPVYNGISGWQIYHDLHTGVNDGLISWRPVGESVGYNGILKFPFDRWMHVKLVVSGTQAEMYFDGEDKPSAYIKDLKMGEKTGAIGLKCSAGPVHFANFSVQHSDRPALSRSEKSTMIMPPNTIKKWQISNAFGEKDILDKTTLEPSFLKKFQWQELSSDKTGMANISKVILPKGEEDTVLAKLVINAENDQIKRLDIGYSDRVRAYCNGQIIYSGNNGFRTRDYRYLGTIGYFDAVYLPLKKGENTVLLAVSESFGGWAIQGKLENTVGLEVR
ncbi:MAG: hypothetical protein DHS20C18_32010 [Saprospiraceae bacterium]|nr:MAG: hypothetical protein DHS20C18_32010 [Saprospiraceae bacterium]